MRKTFFSFYHPTDEQFKTLWSKGLVAVDANVLLNLYRYPATARDELLRALRQVSSRLFIPYQAALEYQKNRLAVIAEQINRFNDVHKALEDIRSNAEHKIGQLNLRKRHSSINADSFIEQLKTLLENFQANLQELEKDHPDVFNDDQIRDTLDELFKGKVGEPPDQEMLNRIYEEGQTRYEQKLPPGHEDQGKGKSNESVYWHHGLKIDRQYGDLIIWKQLLSHVKKAEIKHLIFVTDDNKADWWWIARSKGDKVIGPHFHLVEEMYTEGGTDMFYMYDSERFMKNAVQYIGAHVSNKSIEEVKSIISTPKDISRNSSSDTAKVILGWIQDQHQTELIKSNRGFPDFSLVTANGDYIGYEVIHRSNFFQRSRDLELLLSGIHNAIFRLRKKSELDHLYIIVVVRGPERRAQIVERRYLDDIELPQKVSLIVGEVYKDNSDDLGMFVPFWQRNSRHISDPPPTHPTDSNIQG